MYRIEHLSQLLQGIRCCSRDRGGNAMFRSSPGAYRSNIHTWPSAALFQLQTSGTRIASYLESASLMKKLPANWFWTRTLLFNWTFGFDSWTTTCWIVSCRTVVPGLGSDTDLVLEGRWDRPTEQARNQHCLFNGKFQGGNSVARVLSSQDMPREENHLVKHLKEEIVLREHDLHCSNLDGETQPMWPVEY